MAGKVVDVTLKLIDKMSKPLNDAGKKLSENANQWSRAGKQIQNAGKSISDAGGKMTAAITLPVAGAGVAAVKLATDFEAGMSKVESIAGKVGKGEINGIIDKANEMGLSFQTGADDTETAMNILSEKAKQMGAQTKFSATESADAFSYMAMAGWKTEDMLDGIEGIMYLAGATGEDLASTSDIVTDSLTAFGKSAKDTQKFVDTLAATASNSNTDVAMLGESFQYAAPVAGSLGYNVSDVSVALGLMANSGIKASNAGTALRSLMTRMAKPTKESQTAMDALGLSLTDSEGNMKSFGDIMKDMRKGFSGLTESEKASYGAMLAGKTGMSGLLAIVNSSDSDFDKLTDTVNNSTDACKNMYDVANDNLQGQLTILKSTVESIGISFGQKLTPYIKKATAFIQKLADKFNSLTDEQQNTIIKTALVAAAVGPALLVFGKAVGKIGKVVSVVGKVGKAFKTFGTIAGLITSPVGIVIAILGALVAAGILIYKNWDKIKETGEKVFGYVQGVFESVGVTGDFLKEKLAPIGDKFSEIGGKLQELWTVVQPVMSKIGDVVKLVFSTIIGGAIGGAIGLFKSLFSSITDIIGGILRTFGGLIDFVTGVFTGNWSKAWGGIKDIFGGVFDALISLCKMPINAVIGIINGAIAGINKLGIKVPDWVPVIGGKDFSINIPKIPTLAVGTDNWKGGIVQVSEKGGEIIDLPQGSRVYPHDETVKKAYADGARRSAASITIAKLADQIIVREDADIDKIADKLAEKLERISMNMGGGELGWT